jgi:hypothetical protein
MGNANNVLVPKNKGRRPFRRHGCRWEDIGMDLRETG